MSCKQEVLETVAQGVAQGGAQVDSAVLSKLQSHLRDDPPPLICVITARYSLDQHFQQMPVASRQITRLHLLQHVSSCFRRPAAARTCFVCHNHDLHKAQCSAGIWTFLVLLLLLPHALLLRLLLLTLLRQAPLLLVVLLLTVVLLMMMSVVSIVLARMPITASKACGLTWIL